MSRDFAEESALRIGARSLGVSDSATGGDSLVFDSDGEIYAGTACHTESVTLATDETFAAVYVFDFGNVSTAYVQATLLATEADGETFALDHLYVKVSTIDSRTWGVFDPGNSLAMTPNLAADDDLVGGTILSSRYLQVTAEIDDADNADVIYAGVNLPVAHVRFDVEYR